MREIRRVFLVPIEIFVEVLAEFDFEREANTSYSPLDNILLLSSSQHNSFKQIIINYQEQITIMKAQLLKLTEIRETEAEMVPRPNIRLDIEVAMP